jgi:hypothetical protein
VAVERRGASRAVAILTVYLCLGIALGVIAWLVLPRFVAELEDLLVQLPPRTRDPVEGELGWRGGGRAFISAGVRLPRKLGLGVKREMWVGEGGGLASGPWKDGRIVKP